MSWFLRYVLGGSSFFSFRGREGACGLTFGHLLALHALAHRLHAALAFLRTGTCKTKGSVSVRSPTVPKEKDGVLRKEEGERKE